jgi:hypothetical protein
MITQHFRQKPYAYTTKETAPLSVAGTGNITTVGTAYTTASADQLQEGDFVVSLTGDEVRLVAKVLTSTTGVLSEAFTSDLSAVALAYVRKEDIEFVYEISVAADYGSDSEVDGVALKAGTSQTFRMPELSAFPQGIYLEPKIVDGATGNCTVTISKLVSF